MKQKLLQLFGWYGTIAIVAAYFLVSFGILTADSFWFQFLNVTGALGIVVVSLMRKAYQPAVLNIVWTVIGIIAIIRILI